MDEWLRFENRKGKVKVATKSDEGLIKLLGELITFSRSWVKLEVTARSTILVITADGAIHIDNSNVWQESVNVADSKINHTLSSQ